MRIAIMSWFRKKIDALLSNDDLQVDERLLVALTLQVRFPTTVVDSPVLFHFCIRLLRTNHPTFVRLASRWVSCLHPNHHEYNGKIMAETLLVAIQDRTHLPIDAVDDDLIHALGHLLEMDNSILNDIRDFDTIWHRIVTGTSTTSNQNDPPPEETSSSPHWRFMDQTIAQMLQHEDTSTWMHSFLCLWESMAPKLCKSITSTPNWYDSMLLFLVSNEQNLKTNHDWHGMVFKSTNALFTACTTNLTFPNVNVANALADIIMVHLGSPQSTLNSQAWATCSILVSRNGWDWLPEPIMDRPCLLTEKSHLCTWTRLAAGEFRIQLGLRCTEPSNAFHDEALQASGLVVMAALRRALQESELLQDDVHPATLDVGAILHLRHSFLDTLQSAICYFSIDSSPMSSVGRVLGSLLAEFCIWDEMPHGTTPYEALLAVRKCMSIGIVEIMPCLATIVAPELLRNSERMQSLESAGIFDDEWETYFSRFWTETLFHNEEYIPYACNAIESWVLIATPTMKKRTRLATKILGWIKTILTDGVADSLGATLLQSAVGCYVVLLGVKPPSEEEAAVIKLALAVGETKEHT
jgi:hypothetical protein